MDINRDFRQVIDTTAKRLDVSLARIARMADINHQTLYNYMSGRSEIRSDLLARILNVLDKMESASVQTEESRPGETQASLPQRGSRAQQDTCGHQTRFVTEMGGCLTTQDSVSPDYVNKAGDRQIDTSRFDLWQDQQKRFTEALLDYDPHIWFPHLRGCFEENVPGNWFIAFVPLSWGRWTGAVYGVHFDFLYARPRRSLPERIRLVIGVETPMPASKCQTFKEDVISKVKAMRICHPGFLLQAQRRKKLLETDPSDAIPFNNQSWRISLERYKALQPLVEVIAMVSRQYYDKGAFTCQWLSPPGR